MNNSHKKVRRSTFGLCLFSDCSRRAAITNYRGIDYCHQKYETKLGLFRALREAIQEECDPDRKSHWFTVENGKKPWVFSVDWLCTTYRFSLSVTTEENGEMRMIKECVLDVDKVVEESDGEALFALGSAIVRDEGFKMSKSGNYYSVSQASAIFFELIREPLDI